LRTCGSRRWKHNGCSEDTTCILDLKLGVRASGNTDRQAPCGSSRVVPARGRISAFIRHTMRCYDVLSQTPKAARNPLSRVQRWPFSHIHVPPSANCARAWSVGSDCAVATTATGWSQPPSLPAWRMRSGNGQPPLWGLPH
jgi:hypothetical protein